MSCLDESLVLAFVRGELESTARVAAEHHLADCPACTELVAAAASVDGVAEPGSPVRRRTSLRLSRGAPVDRYLIIDRIGRGGMGEVYAAYDPKLDRKVALKLLHEAPTVSTRSEARKRLLREAKTIARLSHPNVVVVYDAGEVDERVFVAMEFIDGQTLAEWLRAAPRPWRQIRDVFVAAGKGLAAAHEAGFVHRDFKPQNVMVGKDGLARVMDFGLASDTAGVPGDRRLIAPELGPGALGLDSIAITRTGSLVGTPAYMAPEQFERRATDPRTDQFSFCVALYEALHGERPFSGRTFQELADAVTRGQVRKPLQRQQVPAFLRELLLRGLQPDPERRFPTMAALLSALARDPRVQRRRAMTGAAIAVAGVALIALLHTFANRGERLCAAGGDKVATAWDAPGGLRRETVHHAFAAIGGPFAEETWGRVAAVLDDYARRWIGMYREACEATNVHGDQSTEILDLRMTCLKGRLSSLRALTDLLASADSAVLVQAVGAAQSLPPLDRCADVPLLSATVPPPTGRDVAARVAQLRDEVARVQALIDTGQAKAARPRAELLVSQARALDYQPVLAQALLVLMLSQSRLGDTATDAVIAEEALWAAMASRDDDVALRAVSLMVDVFAHELGRPDEAARWVPLGQALLRRLGPGHDLAAAWFASSQGELATSRGRYREAAELYETSLRFKEKALPADHEDLGIGWINISHARLLANEREPALRAVEEGYKILVRAYGAQSPTLATALLDRGEALAAVGRHPEAERDLRASALFFRTLVGPDHPWTAHALTGLGKSLVSQGRASDAIPSLEEAMSIRRKSEPDAQLVAETSFALAEALWQTRADRARAKALAQSALAVYRTATRFEPQATEVSRWLAEHSPS